MSLFLAGYFNFIKGVHYAFTWSNHYRTNKYNDLIIQSFLTSKDIESIMIVKEYLLLQNS